MNKEQSLIQVRMSTVRPDDDGIAVDGEVGKEYSYQTDSEEEEGDHSSVVVADDREEEDNTEQATSTGVSLPVANVLFLFFSFCTISNTF